MWQMRSAPFLGGGFKNVYAYAPYKMEVRYKCIYIHLYMSVLHICVYIYIVYIYVYERWARRHSWLADLATSTPTLPKDWRYDIYV